MNPVIFERLSVFHRIRFRRLVGGFLRKRNNYLEKRSLITPITLPTNALFRELNNKKSESNYRIIPSHYNNCSVDIIIPANGTDFSNMVEIMNHLLHTRFTDILFGFIFYDQFVTYEQFFQMIICIGSFTEYIGDYLFTISLKLFDIISSIEEEVFEITIGIFFNEFNNKSINQ